MPRFKNKHLEQSYQHALANHATLYREPGHAGTSQREAYSRGYRNEQCLYSRDSLSYTHYAAGKRNAANRKSEEPK